MVKKKRGWWSQIQSGDYPEGQTKYGDKNWITFNIKKNAPIEPTKEEGDSEKSLCQLHDNCPNCGKLYFKDKGKCYSCGWSRSSKNEPVNQVKNKIQPKEIIKKKDTTRTNYAMLCPKCGAKMVLRTAKRGENTGNKFWGCSQFPKVRGTSS